MEKNSVKYGLIAGLGVAIYQLVLYFASPEMIYGNFAYVGWAIYLFCMWKATSLDKEANGGFISFRDAFGSSFIVFAIAAFIALIFQHILITVIDPGLIDIQKEIALEAFDKVANAFGLDEGSPEYEKALEDIDKNSEPSIASSALGYVFLLIGGAIPSLVIAAVMKKDKPAHLQVREDDTEHLIEE